MINEEKLTKHYEKIVEVLDEMIPWKWDKIALYAEDKASIVDFYYILTREDKYIFCDTIQDEYEDKDYDYGYYRNKLEKAVYNLWLEFYNSDEEPWTKMSFIINSGFELSINFAYENLENTTWSGRESYWEYKELDLIDEKEYEYDGENLENINIRLDLPLSEFLIQFRRDEYEEFLKHIGRNHIFNQNLIDKYYELIIESIDEYVNLDDCEEVVIYSDADLFNVGYFKKLKNENKYIELYHNEVDYDTIQNIIKMIYLEQGKNKELEEMTAFIFRIDSKRNLKAKYRKMIENDGLDYRIYHFAFLDLEYIPKDKSDIKIFGEYLKAYDKDLYEKFEKALRQIE